MILMTLETLKVVTLISHYDRSSLQFYTSSGSQNNSDSNIEEIEPVENPSFPTSSQTVENILEPPPSLSNKNLEDFEFGGEISVFHELLRYF